MASYLGSLKFKVWEKMQEMVGFSEYGRVCIKEGWGGGCECIIINPGEREGVRHSEVSYICHTESQTGVIQCVRQVSYRYPSWLSFTAFPYRSDNTGVYKQLLFNRSIHLFLFLQPP